MLFLPWRVSLECEAEHPAPLRTLGTLPSYPSIPLCMWFSTFLRPGAILLFLADLLAVRLQVSTVLEFSWVCIRPKMLLTYNCTQAYILLHNFI